MKKLVFAIAISLVLKGNAQPYLISFAGTGASTTVNSVKVENLKSGATLILTGGDILRLSSATGVYPIENGQSHDLKIYPNPTTGNSTLEFFPPVPGDAIISVYEMTGRPVARIQSYLENYTQEFRLSGIKSGSYLISVKGNNYQFSGKLLCSAKAVGKISIEKISNNHAVAEKKSTLDSKGAQATVDMVYAAGDWLKFTGISGNYSTVMTDIPASDKTVTFNFIACSDGDGNNYPVVQIGTAKGTTDNLDPAGEKGVQTWMASNLKATHYATGTLIPKVTGTTNWDALTTTSKAYCWYNDDSTANSQTYGALYTWAAAINGAASSTSNPSGIQGVCPAGWHLPSDAEWTQLTGYLGGESVAGGKLKETGSTHWGTNSGATNETGFTALPGGYRDDNGAFDGIHFRSQWLSATEGDANHTLGRFINFVGNNIVITNYTKGFGLSVRCVRD